MSLVDHVRSPELVTILLLETSWGDPQLQGRGVGAKTGRGGVQGAHLEPGPPEQSLQRFLYGSTLGQGRQPWSHWQRGQRLREGHALCSRDVKRDAIE